MHTPGVVSPSKGMHRMVALVSSFIFLRLGLGSPVPMGKDKYAILYINLELFVRVHYDCPAVTEFKSAFKETFLDIVEFGGYMIHNSLDRICVSFSESVAAHYLYGAFLNVTLADGESYRNALNLIVGELESWTLIVGIVIFHTDATAAELVDNRLNLGGNFLETFLILIYGHNHYLNGSQSWREHESVVIAVSHYEGLPSDAWRLPRR